MNNTNAIEIGATKKLLNINIKDIKLNIKMCPALMFANKRIINAKGLVNTPINSMGIINIFNGPGTGGLKCVPSSICFHLYW